MTYANMSYARETAAVGISSMVSSTSQVHLLVLASTFYTPAFEKPFAGALANRGDARPQLFVPYNQLHSFLLNPTSLIPPDMPANVILFLRIEDVVRPELANSDDAVLKHIESMLDSRASQLAELLVGSEVRATVLICPSGRGCLDVTRIESRLRILEHKIAAVLRLRGRHTVIEWFDLPDMTSTAGNPNLFNIAGDRLGHVPFTPHALEALARYFVDQLDQLPVTRISAHAEASEGLALEKFLASLNVEFTAEPMLSDDEQSIVDLVRHTTHFINLVDRKWDRETLANLAAPGEAWTIRVRDRFGDYGISGAVTYTVEAGVMRIKLVFLTCPVLGKQVENALFAWLAQIAGEHRATRIEIPFSPGRDNEGLCNLLSRLAGELDNSLALQSEKVFCLPVIGLADQAVNQAVNPEAVSKILSAMSAGATA